LDSTVDVSSSTGSDPVQLSITANVEATAVAFADSTSSTTMADNDDESFTQEAYDDKSSIDSNVSATGSDMTTAVMTAEESNATTANMMPANKSNVMTVDKSDVTTTDNATTADATTAKESDVTTAEESNAKTANESDTMAADVTTADAKTADATAADAMTERIRCNNRQRIQHEYSQRIHHASNSSYAKDKSAIHLYGSSRQAPGLAATTINGIGQEW
jgi:hypothetical protein